jgi:hypothetical protein
MGTLALALVAGGLSWGDDKKDTSVKSTAQLPPNFKKLGLSDEQEKKCREIHGRYRAKIQDLEEQLKQLRIDEVKEWSQVLTDEQKAKLKELVEKKLLGDDVKDGDKPKDGDKSKDGDKPVGQ